MKILLACSAGMSTSLLEKSINDYMEKEGIKGEAKAFGSETAKQRIADFDIILLGPQVRFMEKSFKELTDKPVAVIPPQDYALAKGENVFKTAKEILNK